jgi:hypothetical protein
VEKITQNQSAQPPEPTLESVARKLSAMDKKLDRILAKLELKEKAPAPFTNEALKASSSGGSDPEMPFPHLDTSIS